MKVVKSILVKLIYAILIILASYNIYNYVCINVLKQDLPTINGYGTLEVISGSMEPTIKVGDLIIVNTKYDELKENDIITFYDEKGSFVTHRIIEIKDGEYITKGDNNNSEDQGTINNDDIVAKYVTRLNGMGKLMAAFKNPITMIMILVIGILVCVLVSTDKEGNPIITEEEKEYEEFLKYKENSEKEKKSTKTKEVKNTTKSIVENKKKVSNTNTKKETTTKAKNSRAKVEEKKKTTKDNSNTKTKRVSKEK